METETKDPDIPVIYHFSSRFKEGGSRGYV